MATKDEKEKSFPTYAGEVVGKGYGNAKNQFGDAASGFAKIGSDVARNTGKVIDKSSQAVSGFMSGVSAGAASTERFDPYANKPTEYGAPSYTSPQPAPAAMSAVAPTSPAAETPQANPGMPEPQPADMTPDVQGYLPQDYLMPGMLRRPENQGGGDPFSEKGSSFSTVSGPQNDLSVAAQFNKQSDMMAAQNKRKGPAIYASVGTPGDMSGGGNIGVNKKSGGIQGQIGKLLSSMPYGSAGDRAKRNSILKQADIMMKGYTADQRTQQQGMQFDQEMAFKEGNADTMAQQYAMGYAQKEGQFGQEMDFKRQQAMQQQSNVGNQLALDYYKADKTATKESMPFTSAKLENSDGSMTMQSFDKRTGEYRDRPEQPPISGAQLAPDGNWYVPDENKAGSFKRVDA